MPERLLPEPVPPPDELSAVYVRGSVDRARVDGLGRVVLGEDAVVVTIGEREIRLPLSRLDDVDWRDGRLSLVTGDERLEMTGDPRLAAFRVELTTRATTVPELTRGLRGLGTRRSGAEVDHDQFFGMLMEARRSAEMATDLEGRLAAFDARRLLAGLERVIGGMAARRHGEAPPYRRALEAELLELTEPLFAALESLGSWADQVRTGSDTRRLAAWREWVRAARRVFEEAERGWSGVREALDAATPPPARRR
jgi:hypothetical protein